MSKSKNDTQTVKPLPELIFRFSTKSCPPPDFFLLWLTPPSSLYRFDGNSWFNLQLLQVPYYMILHDIQFGVVVKKSRLENWV